MKFTKICLLVTIALYSCGSEKRRAGDVSATESFGDQLPLVQNRTAIASEVLTRQLPQLPVEIVSRAACIAVMSRDSVAWGMRGTDFGAGMISCRLEDGTWSAPSYLGLSGSELGPNIGFMNQHATFLYMPEARDRAFASSTAFGAGVYAIAGAADVQLSVDTTGCITFDLLHEHRRHCVMAFSEDFGVKAGAYVSAIRTRHLMGFLGTGTIGRNARVYGSGTSVNQILTMPASQAPSITQPWISTLNYLAP